MEDRRQMRRFTLRLPCLIYDCNDACDELLFEAQTINVSIGGAFVETDQFVPEGTPVQINLLIRRQERPELAGGGSCISLNGHVVRSNATGLGVAFGDQYRIMRTLQLAGQCRAVSQWLHQWDGVSEQSPPIPLYEQLQ
jgi:hypothetical protein